MFKELIAFLSRCPDMEKITSCANSAECDTVAIMPLKGMKTKKYTDGREMKTVYISLLKKAFYSPLGDNCFEADTFFENVTNWLKEQFNQGDTSYESYHFVLIEPTDIYTIDTFSSIGIYSLKLKVVYEKI